MNRNRYWTTFGFSLLFSGLVAFTDAAVHAASEPEIELDYRRDAVERPAAIRPVKALPSELALTSGDSPGARIALPEKNAGGARSISREIARKARAAATWAAGEMVETRGRREAFAMGYFDGLHTALDDPRLGRWDYRDGLERGRHARDARRAGSRLGEDTARETAERTAYTNVSAQFHDLSREPRPRRSAAAPPFAAVVYEARAPRLEAVFHELANREPSHGRIDPWTFYRYRGYRDFHDSRWWEPARALDRWIDRERSYWRALDDEEKGYFRTVFRYEYPRKVAHLYAGVAERAYRSGFDRGWDDGARVSYEWNYRLGYHEGWNQALRTSAEAAYHRRFPSAYSERYSAWFREWETSPRPEIRRVELFDENDDGVFEPGESLWVEYEITNYGGAPGRFDVRLEGQVLSRGASDRVVLPRRTVWASRRPLEAAIGDAVQPRTASELGFFFAELEHRLPLEVSYPLELATDSRSGRCLFPAEGGPG